MSYSSTPSLKSGKYPLSWLKEQKPADMTKSKPHKLRINGISYNVSNWKEATINFVRALLGDKLLKRADLPFYLGTSSGKAYLHSSPKQPLEQYDGLFERVDDGFYVDVKYNAAYHVKNMWKTLEKLGLESKWDVELEIFWN